MEKSKALVVKEKNVLEFVDLEKPEARDYEVLVKVKACSLCTLDRRVYLGTRSRQWTRGVWNRGEMRLRRRRYQGGG